MPGSPNRKMTRREIGSVFSRLSQEEMRSTGASDYRRLMSDERQALGERIGQKDWAGAESAALESLRVMGLRLEAPEGPGSDAAALRYAAALRRAGYYPCRRCGQVVKHSAAGDPYHMHRYSKKCRDKGRRIP